MNLEQKKEMEKIPFLIDEALKHILSVEDTQNQMIVKATQSYILKQCHRWAKNSSQLLNEQDVMYGLLRSCVIMRGDKNIDDSLPISLKVAVETPFRVPMIRYGVRSHDEKSVKKAAFLMDMLYDERNQPLYENQGLFIATLINRLVEGNKPMNKTTTEMARVMIDSILRLPQGHQKSALGCLCVKEWPCELSAYLEEAQIAKGNYSRCIHSHLNGVNITQKRRSRGG